MYRHLSQHVSHLSQLASPAPHKKKQNTKKQHLYQHVSRLIQLDSLWSTLVSACLTPASACLTDGQAPDSACFTPDSACSTGTSHLSQHVSYLSQLDRQVGAEVSQHDPRLSQHVSGWWSSTHLTRSWGSHVPPKHKILAKQA